MFHINIPLRSETCGLSQFNVPTSFLFSDHSSIPHVSQIDHAQKSFRFALQPTDVYELNSILKNVLVYYQPVKVYPVSNDKDVIFQQVLAAMNYSAFSERSYPVNHTEYFANEINKFDLDGLESYMLYAIQLSYNTSFSVGNRTKLHILRTTEDGEIKILKLSNLSGIVDKLWVNLSCYWLKITTS